MSSLLVLEGVELIPVLELVPFKFAAEGRSSPSGTGSDMPEEWFRYWSDSLADSGITGLTPIRRGSWHVPMAEFANPKILRRFLDVILQDWGGLESLSDPDGKPILSGGLALHCPSQTVLIDPTCCADLGNLSSWHDAADYREGEWEMLWIGHPWLSMKYEAPWLVISGPHESSSPTARWAICPSELRRAVGVAEAELKRFSEQIATTLIALGFTGDSELTGWKLAGVLR